MRCYNCRKNFDYEKYYGICPKCGCFNKRETQEERHEELHDRFGDDSDHKTERKYGARQPSAPYPEASGAGSRPVSGGVSGAGVYAVERKKKRGTVVLVLSIVILMVGIVTLGSGIAFLAAGRPQSGAEADDTLRLIAHEAGESFGFQQGSVQVLEAKKLADQDSLPNLEDGMELIAVHAAGQGDGEYEDYNRLAVPYLEADGTYRRALSSYEFEAYGQILGVYPVLDEWSLMGEASFDGWYGFLVEEGTEEVRFWLDEYDGSDWDGGRLLAGHYVDLTVKPLESGAEGGEADGQ